MPIITELDRRTEAEAIFAKVVKAARKATTYVAYTDLSLIDGVWIITIETNIPEGVGDLAEEIIKKSKRAMWGSMKCHPGSFDWASDTYIKDCVLIAFKV